MTQQHCIADCAKKHGTNQESNQPQQIIGMIGGKRRKDHANEADHRGNAVQHRVAASECCERNDCQPHSGRLTHRHVIECKPQRHTDERNSCIYASQQFAVSHRDLTGAQCEPQKEHAPARPLEHHGCSVELHGITTFCTADFTAPRVRGVSYSFVAARRRWPPRCLLVACPICRPRRCRAPR